MGERRRHLEPVRRGTPLRWARGAHVWVAAALGVVALGSCDGGPSEPIDLRVTITSHRDGDVVNANQAAGAPVHLVCRGVVPNVGTIPASALTWTINGQAVGSGDRVTTTFSVGNNTVVCRGTHRGTTAEDRITLYVPTDEETLGALTITRPHSGERFVVGESVPCQHAITNPRSLPVTLEWRLGDTQIECSSQGVLVPSGSSEASVLAFGEHTLSARAQFGSVTHEASVDFRVILRPWGITFDTGTFGLMANLEFYLFGREDQSGSLRQLTTNGGMKHWFRLSPDSSKFAYAVLDPEVCQDIFVSNHDFTNRVKVSGNNCASLSSGAPVWSPDGTRLAYIGADPIDGRRMAYIVNTDGSGRRMLPTRTCVPGTFDTPPCYTGVQGNIAFFPNGREVVLPLQEVIPVSGAAGGIGLRDVIVRWNIATNQHVRLWAEPIQVDENQQARGRLGFAENDVSPDGRWVVASTFFTGQVFVVRSDGSESNLITDEFGENGMDHRAGFPFFCRREEMGVCYMPVPFAAGAPSMNTIRWVSMDGQQNVELVRAPGLNSISRPHRWPPFEP